MKNGETKFDGGQFKRRGLSSGLSGVHLCCTFFWHYYSKVFTVGIPMLLVYLCWTVGIAMPDLWYQNASLFWYRFFI